EGEQVDVPDLCRTSGGENTQTHREHPHGALREDQQASFVDPVHDRTAQEAEEEHRQELERRGQTESDSAPATELEDQPVLGDALHPGTGVGQKLTQGVQAVITYGQGSEHGDTCHPFLPVLPGLRGEAVWVQYW